MTVKTKTTIIFAVAALFSATTSSFAGDSGTLGIDAQHVSLSTPWSAAPQRAPLSPMVSQVYGERCVTEVGWCPIHPQPVGAPCLCGDVEGTTTQ